MPATRPRSDAPLSAYPPPAAQQPARGTPLRQHGLPLGGAAPNLVQHANGQAVYPQSGVVPPGGAFRPQGATSARPAAWAERPMPPPAGAGPHGARPNGAPPTYGATRVQTWGAHHLTGQLEQVRGEVNAHLKKHPLQNNAGRVVTLLGTVAAIGAGVATGVLVLGGAFAALSGIGIPAAAAAALGGVGVGLAGIGLAALAGAATRAIARSNVKKDPALAAKLDVLQKMQGELMAKKTLTPDEKVMLRNVGQVLGKVSGVKAHLKSQLKLAGKTTLAATLSVGLLALLAVAEGDGGGMWFWGSSPLPLPDGIDASGRPLHALPGEASGTDDVARWSQALHELGVHN